MDERRELIDRPCMAAGMIMEDTVEEAIGSGPAAGLPLRITAIEQAGRDIMILAQAAAGSDRRRAVDNSRSSFENLKAPLGVITSKSPPYGDLSSAEEKRLLVTA